MAVIGSIRPDLVLLDLQMPERAWARRGSAAAHQGAMPLVAFVTAFDDHAIEAFELNAIDYLLKPVQLERLQATVARARERLRLAEAGGVRAAAFAQAAAAVDRPAVNRGYWIASRSGVTTRS